MSLSEAFWIAAAVAVICSYFIGEKLLDFDFSAILPSNLKRAKLKRLLVKRETPLQGMGLHGNIKKEFEKILIPLGKADKSLLPARMDMTFRRELERQLDCLNRRQACRDIRLTDVVPLPKNDFKRWSDDGRECRESVLKCSTLERLISADSGKPVYKLYRKNANVRILQSRHIRSSDRTEQKQRYYAERVKILCPSCGAEVELDSQQTVCPYCGGLIQSDFYDWQTEIFEIYEKIGANTRNALQLSASTIILFVCLFLCLWLIKDTEVSLTAGVGAALSVLTTVFIYSVKRRRRQEMLVGEIVRYSENYLRSCIDEALYKDVNDSNLMSHSVGTIILKDVVNTEKTTEITVRVYLSETYLPQDKKPYTKKLKRTLTLQRARYPERRKSEGKLFDEKSCPSCGANFIPDENHCCSFCGYTLKMNNAKWVVKATRAQDE